MRLWLSTCALLIFAAGCAVGLLLGRRDFEPVAPPAGEVSAFVDPHMDYPLYLVSSEEIYEQLGLAAEQTQAIESLFVRHFERVQVLSGNMGRLSAELRQGVLRILTPTQAEKFDEIQEYYAKSKVRSFVDLKLAELRSKIQLRQNQEADTYRILFDAAVERKKIHKQRRELGRDIARARQREVCATRNERLKGIFTPEQHAAYLGMKERWKRLRARCEKKTEQPTLLEPANDTQPTPAKLD